MKNLKMTRYYTMNSWNQSSAPAFNLKIYNVIPKELQNKVYELMESNNFYDNINMLMSDFEVEHNYLWQVGFNGRSEGYIVLYKGGRKKSDYKSYCTKCGQKNFTSIKENNKKCGRCGEYARVDKEFFETFSYPGKHIDNEEVPKEVLKAFKQLAKDIVNETIYMAKNFNIEEEVYTVEKTRKVLVEK